jgi:hypothetical protein
MCESEKGQDFFLCMSMITTFSHTNICCLPFFFSRAQITSSYFFSTARPLFLYLFFLDDFFAKFLTVSSIVLDE